MQNIIRQRCKCFYVSIDCAVTTNLLMSGGLNTNQAFDWPIKTIGSVRSVITWNVLNDRLMGGGVGSAIS